MASEPTSAVLAGAAEGTPIPIAAIAPSAPDNAPNVLLILTDDVGFGATSPFGGAVPKPNLERLANHGLRYNQFHTTAICSPTRAALLSGRNHHQVGHGMLAEVVSPYAGYTGIIPPSATTVARILRDNGYGTAMFGKDHNVPMEHRSAAGPFLHWPTSRGFEYFYGFVEGDTDQYKPALFQGTSPVDGSLRDEGYIFDQDMIDRTIAWIHTRKAAAPDKPLFIYQAYGTAHAPQQVPAEWIERFRGQFDHGWDVERQRTLERQLALGIVPEGTQLADRPEEIPAWSSLSDAEKKVYARMMEVYAAMLAHQDYQLGRLLDELERMGELDNTLVIYVEGDNGAAAEVGVFGSLNELADIMKPEQGRGYDVEWLAENLDIIGGPETYPAIPAGWSFAMNTPFPWLKQVASHLGGVRNGLVISWPDGIEQVGELRSQYHHIIDVMPTILEAIGIDAPETVDGVTQQPIDGTSMVYSFGAADAPSTRRTQYYEILGNRAIYHEGWLANTVPKHRPWDMARVGAGSDVTAYEWELYDLRRDFSQSQNLAEEYPDKLAELQAVFDAEARKHQVYPIHNSSPLHRGMELMRLKGQAPRSEWVYWGGDIRMSAGVSPPLTFLPFTVEADIEVPEGGAEGVIYAAGSYFGGWSFYLHDGVPVVAVGRHPQPGGSDRVAAADSLPAGSHRLVFDVDFREKGALVKISVNDVEVAHEAVAERPLFLAGNGETFDTGRDTNVPVSTDYENEGVFTGVLNSVRVTVKLPGQ